MKTFWTALSLALLLNFLAFGGAVAYLGATGRLDQARLARLADIVATPLAEEQARLEAEKAQREEQIRLASDAARLEVVSEGPLTVQDRLDEEELRRDVAMQRIERLEREKEDLLRQLNLYKQTVSKMKDELDAERAAFELAKKREIERRDDADFQQAVELYEQLPPKQAKGMFSQLIADGRLPQVVDYLAAMQVRRASAVLKEFKQPEEVAVAAMLVQQLRNRGVTIANGTDG